MIMICEHVFEYRYQCLLTDMRTWRMIGALICYANISFFGERIRCECLWLRGSAKHEAVGLVTALGAQCAALRSVESSSWPAPPLMWDLPPPRPPLVSPGTQDPGGGTFCRVHFPLLSLRPSCRLFLRITERCKCVGYF